MSILELFGVEAIHKNVDAAFLMGVVAISLAVYTLGTIIYRLWFHPLAKIPGPKYMAVWDVPSQWYAFVSLDMAKYATKLHRKYGPIVRIGPDRLIMDGSIAWPKVYGVRSISDDTEFSKLRGFMSPNDHMALLGANREEHRRQRRQLGHAFSAAAIHEQEAIIMKYIDKLIYELTVRAKRDESVDIVNWFNFTTFDVIGDLAFADSFHSLDGNTNFVHDFFRGLVGTAYNRFLMQFPLLKAPLILILGSKELAMSREAGKANFKLGRLKARARMAMGAEPKDGRRDFSTYMLKKDKNGEQILSDAEIQELSSVLVVAGSETTSTAMSGIVFLLGRYADKRRILEEEIRTTFADEADINMTSTAHLVYLQAVIEESLRMYPPGVTLPPRKCPGAEINGHWLPRGTLIHVYTPSTFRNPKSFVDANSFEPERWLKPNHPRYDPRFADDKKEVLKPFSYGSRDCIGKNLAYAEMRVTISRLIYRFNLKVLPGQDDWMLNQKNTFLWIKDGLQIQLQLRPGLELD